MRRPPAASCGSRVALAWWIGLALVASSYATRREPSETEEVAATETAPSEVAPSDPETIEPETAPSDPEEGDHQPEESSKRPAARKRAASVASEVPAPAASEAEPARSARSASSRSSRHDSEGHRRHASRRMSRRPQETHHASSDSTAADRPASNRSSRAQDRPAARSRAASTASTQGGAPPRGRQQAAGKSEEYKNDLKAKVDMSKSKHEEGLAKAIDATKDLFKIPVISWNDWFVYNLDYFDKDVPTNGRIQKREGTKKYLAQMLGFPNFQALNEADFRKADMSKVYTANKTCLFRDAAKAKSPEGLVNAGGEFLLGRYEVLCACVIADLDYQWERIERKRNFYVAHAAALNVGERQDTAYDFQYFSNADKFDKSKYAKAMGRIVKVIVGASIYLNITDLIFFPFGMGAFLRNLRAMDSDYGNQKLMQRLREDVTLEFMKALASTSKSTRVHLCLRFTPLDADAANIETLGNTAAFLKAFRNTAAKNAFGNRLTVWPDADSMYVAHVLAQDKQSNVMLVNGANRKKIGNHWYENGAFLAIDENIHRRSWTMSAISYYVNSGFKDTKERRQWDLTTRVKELEGKTLDITIER
eukprot:TRINITY_DN65847_c0_g1_i1.p1 TRINITY_DN65847_c0_g1~~TRINITY_DN65847_c0_g1_i1.p1  ORF type:complete len:593 (+),score=77.33 TRINITY_DN65847_c0_g1_i1:78-1856(+)